MKWRSVTGSDGGGGGELGKPSRGVCGSSRKVPRGQQCPRQEERPRAPASAGGCWAPVGGSVKGQGPGPGQGRASWSPAPPEASRCR